ncbi:Inosine-5'-monophosphate dehydrogenase [Fundidesulfovibrio magnetotacticus]|uniref:Inosine-5'-monophosphate dehydrogenase n=1 Tax=Fundidesulfovibrio magnetotacticus TaxID=2730080 RepID=A0A6V8LXD1_9BACT|nr:CBS domain-containing protein [Fundidesulfovibrio magnetotacticus]GFK94918.1 Inosine-5'-monophosphate dehydrogenase [Fundidesulfovibrio magnetotacticus]
MPGIDLLEPSEEDVREAMRSMALSASISPADAKALFKAAQVRTLARLRAAVLVRDLMSRELTVLAPDTPLDRAAALLARAGISGAPVCQGARLVGVVSVKDFLCALGLPKDAPPVALAARVLSGGAAVPASLPGGPVSRIMTTPPLSVSPQLPASDAAGLMAREGVRRLPVVEDGRLVGIITQTDLLHAFGNLLGEMA